MTIFNFSLHLNLVEGEGAYTAAFNRHTSFFYLVRNQANHKYLNKPLKARGEFLGIKSPGFVTT